jgi:hypothetical protein
MRVGPLAHRHHLLPLPQAASTMTRQSLYGEAQGSLQLRYLAELYVLSASRYTEFVLDVQVHICGLQDGCFFGEKLGR